MIDVVFQLIIFFLVSNHLAKQEALLPLPLPTAGTGQMSAARSSRAVVNVLADGRLQIHGREVSAARLEDLLAEMQAERGPLEVRIRADRRVVYRHIQPVLRACWRAGVQEVTFSVYRNRG